MVSCETEARFIQDSRQLTFCNTLTLTSNALAFLLFQLHDKLSPQLNEITHVLMDRHYSHIKDYISTIHLTLIWNDWLDFIPILDWETCACARNTHRQTL